MVCIQGGRSYVGLFSHAHSDRQQMSPPVKNKESFQFDIGSQIATISEL